MSDALRLYVWRNIWCDHTCGVAFALARTPNDARQLIVAAMSYGPEDTWLTDHLDAEPEVYEQPFGFGVMGGG